METDKSAEEATMSLPAAKQLPYFALPLLKRARLAIIDNSESMLELPPKLDLIIGIQHLSLDHSFANSASIVGMINRTYRLKTFVYRRTLAQAMFSTQLTIISPSSP